jgi:hypothetical protein
MARFGMAICFDLFWKTCSTYALDARVTVYTAEGIGLVFIRDLQHARAPRISSGLASAGVSPIARQDSSAWGRLPTTA